MQLYRYISLELYYQDSRIFSIIFALLIVDNVKFNLYVHAWFDMSRVVFGKFVLLVLLTLLSSEQKRFKMCYKIKTFYIVEHIARHVGCSSRAMSKSSHQEAPTTYHVVDVRVLQRVVRTAIS